jgi:FlaA1/EpsC-like NDP-sugar epimerase
MTGTTMSTVQQRGILVVGSAGSVGRHVIAQRAGRRTGD